MPEQGHYRYSDKDDMRPISHEGKVDWIEKNAEGRVELHSIDVVEAIKRIRSEQDGIGQPAAASESKSEDKDKPQPEAEGRSR